MSKLNVNLPITFEAGAALEINGEVNQIKQTVQSYTGQYSELDQRADNISLSVTNIENGLSRTGIDITTGYITLNATNTEIKNGDTTTAMFESGKIKGNLINAQSIWSDNVTATKLETRGDGQYNTDLEKAHIEIEDGLLKVYGTQDVANIVIGSYNGDAILRYFDNTGKMLYDLGPDGIKKIVNYGESATEYNDLTFYEYKNTTNYYSGQNWVNDYLQSSPTYDGTNLYDISNASTGIIVGTSKYYDNNNRLVSFLSRIYNEGYNTAFNSAFGRYYLYKAGYSSVDGIQAGSWQSVELATMANGKYFKTNPCGGTTKDLTWYNNNLLNALFIVKYNGDAWTEVYQSTVSLTKNVDYRVVSGPDSNGYYDIEWLRGSTEYLNDTGDKYCSNICKATDYDGSGTYYYFVNPVFAIKIKAYHNGCVIDKDGNELENQQYSAWYYISVNNLAQ